ncbi:MAG: hypothetical protein A3G15_03530 [Candidatus Levybacteria bacterium RIFCSPLOWO2_12_FULL_40_10]|nr:MAG: hypothetical protein A3G15_03530 [Candidatus Levybacteria bacterium RIFCSPLOWO2_12_FULL_40_10]
MQNSKLQFKSQNYSFSLKTFNFKLLTLKLWRSHNGQALVELLVALAFASLVLPGLITGLVASREGKAQNAQRLEATGLLREGQEALRVIRETSWSQVETNGTYHPQGSGPSWQLISGSETINGYARQITISDAYRDSNGYLVESGTLDPSTKKSVITVSWNTPYPSGVTSTMYLTRYLNNTIFTQTSESDFNSGTLSGTIVTNTNGGEVTLGAGGGGDWCNPNQYIVEDLDLPKSGVANAVSAYEGRILAGTGENSSGVSLADIAVTNTDPPVATISGTFNGYKTNDVYIEGNYGYIGTDTNSKEIVIINMATLPYSESGYFDAFGNTDTNSVFIVGNTGYMTQGNRLRNFNLATCSGGNRTGSCPAIDPDGAAISATGTSVVVSGNYAFVSIAGHVRELEIFNISNPASITRGGWADVNGEAARDVYMNSDATRAYLVTDASSTLPEFFIINTTNKNCSDCPDLGTYNAGTSVNLKAVEIVPGNRAVVIGQGGEEYQVIDISTEASPVRCGGMQMNFGINDSASVLEADGDAYSYIVTGDAPLELKVIEGGPGGEYTTSGTFVSGPFDAGSSVAYNRIIPNFIEPLGTNLELQVAVASDVGGSCTNSSYYFVGPDGTSNTFFATSSAIPLLTNAQGYVNPGRCFKYKAYFSTTDVYAAPVLNDVTVNYSP